MKKKLLSLLLALCLVMALVPMTAFAEGTSVDNWDGSADTSWYTSAPDASAYHISTAEQLAGLAQLVNADPGTTSFAGKTFYLDNDLDLSGHEWISIGTGRGGTRSKYSFCGVFDGQGHVISNLYSHESYIEGRMSPIIYLETLCSAMFTTAKSKTLVLQTLKSGLILKITVPQVKAF